MSIALSIPSPDQGVWQLGPVSLRAYAWCLIAGVAAADPSNEILGLRLNEWTSLVLFVAGLAYLVVAGRRAAESDPSEAWFVADRDADSRDKARS